LIILFLLSNTIVNIEKISFLPSIKGLFSLLDKAQTISTGLSVIFTVILARYAAIPLPSVPQNRMTGNEDNLMPKSLATDLGMMEQSAPVSTKKSNFWYPWIVSTGMGTTGSGMAPNSVRFWFRGNSDCIDAQRAFGGDKANSEGFSVDMLFNELPD
jgi:hypothetical protein